MRHGDKLRQQSSSQQSNASWNCNRKLKRSKKSEKTLVAVTLCLMRIAVEFLMFCAVQ